MAKKKRVSEPAVWIGLISAVISLAVAFGLPLTGDQMGAFMALVTIVASLVTRSQVTPVNKS